MGIEYSAVKGKNTQGKMPKTNNAGWSIIMKNGSIVLKMSKMAKNAIGCHNLWHKGSPLASKKTRAYLGIAHIGVGVIETLAQIICGTSY